eukprot:TRINITY_DN1031_c0_g1_i1.p1 TRINITY_DN1031_c0_g1~~TRINITY_DN1031_c0_g1_i1.p1  ORF type:complete len:281 (-),score=99.12 TRINITY_DN1031_c0_g1_i1:252-1094(-)
MSLKLEFRGQVRRIGVVDVQGNFDKLVELVGKWFSISSVCFDYQDDEKDLIRIGSQIELDEAIKLFPRLLRILVTEKKVAPSTKESAPSSSSTKEEKATEIQRFQVELTSSDATVSSFSLYFESSFDLTTLQKRIQDHIGSTCYSLKYKDEEGDNVTLSTDDELQQLASRYRKQNLLPMTLFIIREKLARLVSSSSSSMNSSSSASSSSASVSASSSSSTSTSSSASTQKSWEDCTIEDLNKSVRELECLGYKNPVRLLSLVTKHKNDLPSVVAELERDP